MTLHTLKDLERSVGGRPRLAEPMVRLSLYVPKADAERLKGVAEKHALPVSSLLRKLIRKLAETDQIS